MVTSAYCDFSYHVCEECGGTVVYMQPHDCRKRGAITVKHTTRGGKGVVARALSQGLAKGRKR